MDPVINTNLYGNVFWLFYVAIPFVLTQLVRIVTIVAMKMYDKIPLRDVVFPLIQFFFNESRRLLGFGTTQNAT